MFELSKSSVLDLNVRGKVQLKDVKDKFPNQSEKDIKDILKVMEVKPERGGLSFWILIGNYEMSRYVGFTYRPNNLDKG